MVTGVTGPIGPHDPKFAKEVAIYLSNSPSHAEKTCLKSFFADLRNRAIQIFHVRGPFLLIYTCGHVITFTADGSKVIDLSPSIIQ